MVVFYNQLTSRQLIAVSVITRYADRTAWEMTITQQLPEDGHLFSCAVQDFSTWFGDESAVRRRWKGESDLLCAVLNHLPAQVARVMGNEVG